MADEQMQDEGQDYEVAAREMGWHPKEEWTGPEGKWVDAREFVERGENIMPILRANNKRLRDELLTSKGEVSTLRQAVEESQKAIKALQKAHTAATQRAVEEARKELREQLKQAREIGDVDAELEVAEKLSELKQAQKDVEDVPLEREPEQPKLHPEFVAWQKENPWFGNDSDPADKKRTKAITRIAEDLREEGETSVGRAFMDKCMALLEKQEGKTPTGKTPSKVESGNTVSRGGSGRAFDRLTAEAKRACHDDNDTFVGPGKMFKTVKEWEDHYAAMIGEE